MAAFSRRVTVSVTYRKETIPCARAIIELLLLESDDTLLSAIEEAIGAKARDSGLPIYFTANQIRIAAVTDIGKSPEDWPTWFRNGGYEKEV